VLKKIFVLLFLIFNPLFADSFVLPTEKYDSFEVPPRTHDLIKQENDKKEHSTLQKIEDVVEKVSKKTQAQQKAKIQHKKDKKQHKNKISKLDFVPSTAASSWESLKNPALESEIRKRLDVYYKELESLDKKVSLSLKKADIKNVVNLISKITGTQIVADQDVCGVVENIDLIDIPLSVALRLLTSSSTPPLTILKDHGIWRVAKLSTVVDLLKLSAYEFLENDYSVECITIFNAKWEDAIKKRIESLWTGIVGDKAEKGKAYLVFDDNTHKIMFRSRSAHVEVFKKFLKEIDIEIPQVKIDIRIVLANKDFEESLGFDWSGYYDRRSMVKRTDWVGFGANEDPATAMFKNAANWSMNFVPSMNTVKNVLPIRLPFLFGNKDFSWNRWNVIIDAAENRGEIKTVLKPSLLVNNDEWAEVLVGQEMPHETKIAETVEGQPSNVSTTQYKDIGIKIKIKSMVVPTQESVFMDIFVENSYLTESKFNFRTLPSQEKEGFNYIIETSRSKSRVLLKSGYTTMISGLISNTEEKAKSGIPILQKIPVVGWFFQGNRKSMIDRQLLIFITPTVV